MKVIGGVILFATLILATPATAQQQQMSPDQLKTSIGAMFSAVLEVLASPKMGSAMAKFYRSFYDGLIAEGFSEEEALKIVSSTPLPISSK